MTRFKLSLGLAMPLALVASLCAAPVARAQSPVSLQAGRDSGFLVFKSADGAFAYWLDGRIQIDAATYLDSKNKLASGTEVRRARLGWKTVLYTDWRGEIDIDFAENAVEIKDMWLGYEGFKNTILKVGNFKEPFSLEQLTSSKFVTFMERAYPDNFTPDRHIGAAWSRWGDKWQTTLGFFGQSAGTPDETGRNEATGITGRFTFVPINKEGEVVHLGIGLSRRSTDAAAGADTNTVRYRARPETDVSKARFVTTGKIRSVDYTVLENAEFALVKNAFSVQAEYTQAEVHRLANLKTATFNGYYAYASWFLTGESRPYSVSTGEFDRVYPKSSKGAWELAARISNIDLNDTATGVDIKGGAATNVTLGLNWHVNPNFKWMLNITMVDNDANAKPDLVVVAPAITGDKFTIVGMRFALAF